MGRLNRFSLLWVAGIGAIMLLGIVWQYYEDSLLPITDHPISSGDFATSYSWKYKTPDRIRCNLISWSDLTFLGTSEKLYAIDFSDGDLQFEYELPIKTTNCP